jgi:hypothetical protein
MLLLVLLSAMHRLSATQVLAAMCLSACQFLLNVSVGHWASIAFPRALPRNSFKSSTKNRPSHLLSFISLGVTILGAVIFGGAFVVSGRSAAAWQLPVVASLLGVTTLAYWRVVLPRAARRLDRGHERLVQFLG